MPIRRVVAKSLQCIVGFYLLIKLLCTGRRKASRCGQEESGGTSGDQGGLETGNASRKRDSPLADREYSPKTGVYFVSTSTIADGDTPVIVPWRITPKTYGDPDTLSERLSTHLSQISSSRSSHDISLCSRSIYDDSSIIGLSLLFESDEESYLDEDTTYDFFQGDLQEVFLGDPVAGVAGAVQIQPVGSHWNLEVAAAMNAFRSSRVDHDDIVISAAFPANRSSQLNQTPASVKGSSDAMEAFQQRQIEDWRNDFIPEREATSSTPPQDAAISRFRFP